MAPGGATADLSTVIHVYRGEKFALGGGTDVAWATAQYMKWFDITGTQSAASGLPAFRAHSGLKSAGASFHASYAFTSHWELLASLGYKRLLGDAAGSPVVKERGSPDQFTGALSWLTFFDNTAA